MSAQHNKPKVLVTGAAGFVGARVVESLFLTGAAEVRAGIRQWSSPGLPRLARFPVDIVFCDVMNKSQVEKAMEGTTIIVNSILGDGKVNVEGTQNLLEEAKKHDLQRFVHISTAEVYGVPSGEITETTPYAYTGSEYADSKIEAEKLCIEYQKQGVPVTILRPPIVYGPFDMMWIVFFTKRLQTGRLGIYKGLGEGYCNLLYVDDLVQSIWLAANRKEAIGEAFNINGPEVITWNEYFRRFNSLLNLPDLKEISSFRARFKAISRNVFRATMKLIQNSMTQQMVRRMIGSTRRTAVGRMADSARSSVGLAVELHELNQLYPRKAIYVTNKAQNMLGYHPKYDVNTSLKLSIEWMEHHGIITRSI
jgi:nucleoside-diphosphate-sugar epimerase